MSATPTLLGWLTEIKLARFHDAMVDIGCDTLDFLLDADDEDLADMCDEIKMKKMQRSKLLKSVKKLRASSAAAAAPVTAPRVRRERQRQIAEAARQQQAAGDQTAGGEGGD